MRHIKEFKNLRLKRSLVTIRGIDVVNVLVLMYILFVGGKEMARGMLWVACFLFCFLSTSLINLRVTIVLDLDTVPLWFRKGVYVEFRGRYSEVYAINGSVLFCVPSASEGEEGMTLFRWECLKLNNSVAEIKITVKVIGRGRVFELSTRVFIDVENRDVYSTDGKFCGKTMLWLPTSLEKGDHVIFGYPGCCVEGIVTEKGEHYIETLYGYQKVFSVDFDSGLVNVTYRNKTYVHRLWNWLDYDLDTGVLLCMAGLRAEGTLYVFGIFSLPPVLTIYETNIDIGPGLIWPRILDFLLSTAPVIFFAFVFVFVYWQRKKKHKLIRTRRTKSKN